MLRTLRARLPCPSQELITYPEMNLAEKQPEPPAALHLRLGSQPPHPLEVTLLPLGLLYLLPLPEKKEPRSPARQGYRPEELQTGGWRCWEPNLQPHAPSLSLESAAGTLQRGNKLAREGPSPQLSRAKAVSHSRASERMDERLSSEVRLRPTITALWERGQATVPKVHKSSVRTASRVRVRIPPRMLLPG